MRYKYPNWQTNPTTHLNYKITLSLYIPNYKINVMHSKNYLNLSITQKRVTVKIKPEQFKGLHSSKEVTHYLSLTLSFVLIKLFRNFEIRWDHWISSELSKNKQKHLLQDWSRQTLKSIKLIQRFWSKKCKDSSSSSISW